MKIKVCGLKEPENIIEVAKLMPEYMGFIFYPKSKRYVGEVFKMPLFSSRIKKIGVFVNSNSSFVSDTISKNKLDMIQLHGNESPEYCAVFNKLTPVIKAFWIDEAFDFETLEQYRNCCDYYLFDTKSTNYGGSGNKFDWKILEKYNNHKVYFLSGGIGLEDVEMLKNNKIQFSLIDINSKFETEPGIKNIEKLKQFKNELSGK